MKRFWKRIVHWVLGWMFGKVEDALKEEPEPKGYTYSEGFEYLTREEYERLATTPTKPRAARNELPDRVLRWIEATYPPGKCFYFNSVYLHFAPVLAPEPLVGAGGARQRIGNAIRTLLIQGRIKRVKGRRGLYYLPSLEG